jgi:hypothetical protein
MKKGYRKLLALVIVVVVGIPTGYTMQTDNYKIFLQAIEIIACGFFAGNSIGKFGGRNRAGGD